MCNWVPEVHTGTWGHKSAATQRITAFASANQGHAVNWWERMDMVMGDESCLTYPGTEISSTAGLYAPVKGDTTATCGARLFAGFQLTDVARPSLRKGRYCQSLVQNELSLGGCSIVRGTANKCVDFLSYRAPRQKRRILPKWRLCTLIWPSFRPLSN